MTSAGISLSLSAVQMRRVIAVIRAPSSQLATEAASTLIENGITGIEVTFTTPDAPVAIENIRKRHGEQALVGAGTLVSLDEVAAAHQASSQFLVSPGTHAAVASAMVSTGRLTMTGALTPSEIMHAQSHGVHVMKIFPGALGGPAYLSALKGPFPGLDFMPTGGVSPDNLGEWFNRGAFAVGAGSDLVPSKALAMGDFEDIASRAHRYVAALRKYDQQKEEG